MSPFGFPSSFFLAQTIAKAISIDSPGFNVAKGPTLTKSERLPGSLIVS